MTSESSEYRPVAPTMAPDIATWREEAFRGAQAVDERYYTTEALERQIKGDARRIIDLIEFVELLHDVAHRAWHLMDDSGEQETTDDNGRSDYLHFGFDHERLSAALDALEANGWDSCEFGGPVAS